MADPRPIDPHRDVNRAKRERPITIFIFLLALALRLVWCAVQPTSDQTIDRLPDQREYLELGRNLLDNHVLSFYDPRFGQTIYAYRTPGYPFFIALLDASPRAVRIAQAVLDSSTILAIFLLARRFMPLSSAPVIAAAVLAVNPFAIYFCGLILSETLFTALLAWAILFLVERRLVATGILFLFAIWVRPSALFLIPCLVVLAVWLNRPLGGSYGWGRVSLAIAIVWGVVWVGLFTWALRNHRVLGDWIWTTTNSGITLYDGFNPAATGASDQRFISEMPQLQSINEVERSRYLAGLARGWASQNSARLPGLALAKILRTWSPVPLSSEYARSRYRLLSAAYAVPFDLLVLIGFFSPQLNRRAKLLLAAPAIYFTLVHAMSVGSLRYRVPVEPPLAILAACGCSVVSGRFVARR